MALRDDFATLSGGLEAALVNLEAARQAERVAHEAWQGATYQVESLLSVIKDYRQRLITLAHTPLAGEPGIQE